MTELAATREWMPIESGPMDGTSVLLYVPGVRSWNRPIGIAEMVVGVWEGGAWTNGSKWASDIGDVDQGYESTGAYFVREYLSPAHWMPLPEEPK